MLLVGRQVPQLRRQYPFIIACSSSPTMYVGFFQHSPCEQLSALSLSSVLPQLPTPAQLGQTRPYSGQPSCQGEAADSGGVEYTRCWAVTARC